MPALTGLTLQGQRGHTPFNKLESAVLVENFLSSIGIFDVQTIVHNPSYDQLYEDELQPGLEGFARGYLTELGAINVLTGEYTGRSPKDKFIVLDDTTRESYWWNGNGTKNDNKPIDTAVWNDLKALAAKQLRVKSCILLTDFAVQIKTLA